MFSGLQASLVELQMTAGIGEIDDGLNRRVIEHFLHARVFAHGKQAGETLEAIGVAIISAHELEPGMARKRRGILRCNVSRSNDRNLHINPACPPQRFGAPASQRDAANFSEMNWSNSARSIGKRTE